MASRQALVRQADLTRMLKAYRDAGLPVARTEIMPSGKVIIYTTADETGEPNEWDDG